MDEERDEESTRRHWSGATKAVSFNEWTLRVRNEIADAAKAYEWDKLIALLEDRPEFVDAPRLEGSAFYAPLHQAAHGGASVEVVEKLLELGASRSLKNARGETPLDVARRKERSHLYRILEPAFKVRVDNKAVEQMQRYFHVVILGTAKDLVDEHELRLPELTPLLELEEGTSVHFSVPGMHGGFSYWLAGSEDRIKLVTESWCRVSEGSGQRHEITPNSCNLVDEGFV